MKLLIYLIIGTVIQLVCRMKFDQDKIVDSVRKDLDGIIVEPELENFKNKLANWTVYGTISVIVNIVLWPINVIMYLVACII